MVGRILQRDLTTASDASRSVEIRCAAKVKQCILTSRFCLVKCNIEVKLLFVIGTPAELRVKLRIVWSCISVSTYHFKTA